MRILTLQRRRTQRGSAMVESALVLTVFLTLLFGIIDIGQALFLRTSLAERMRAALRSGSMSYDATEIKNYVLYGTRTPAAGATPSLNLTGDMVAVSRLDQSTSADRVKIVISNYPLIFYTPFLARRWTWPTMTGVQQIEIP